MTKHAGDDLFEKKRAMHEEHAAKREKEIPIKRTAAVVYARELLATLERVSAPNGPSRIAMSAPPPLANDHVTTTPDPEPVGGCFADIAEEQWAKYVDPKEEDEEPFG